MPIEFIDINIEIINKYFFISKRLSNYFYIVKLNLYFYIIKLNLLRI